jgi:CubicO group peptidase (beta-lactamase class C family)
MADLETSTAITPATAFHAASIAKQVTAMAVMLLVRDGSISLEDDIRKTLPEVPDYGTTITIRHLLTHTSGLRDFIELLILARGRFEEERITRADMWDIVKRQRSLNFAPGSEYLYNNTGYALLAEIVERTTGKSLADFARERIFAPLGMNRTMFKQGFNTVYQDAATGYEARGTGWRTSMPNYDVHGPTNLLTTVDDMLRWASNFSSPIVGDSTIIGQMGTTMVLPNGDSTNYGFGISLGSDRGFRVEEHEGSDPGFRAYLGRYPDAGIAVAVLCNVRAATAISFGRRIAALYLPPAKAAPPPIALRVDSTADTTSIARRAGVYFQPNRVEVVEKTWRDGALYTARRGGRKLLPVGQNRYQVEGVPVIHTFGREPDAGYIASSLLPGRTPVTFEWRAPVKPSSVELEQFAGSYFSDELNAAYRIEAGDSTIVLRTGTSDGLIGRPVFADTFVSGQIVIEFERSRGKLTGFRITHPRARRILVRKLD